MKGKRLVFFIVILSFIAVPGLYSWDGRLEIQNDTGFTIYWIYITHNSEEGWGNDRLGKEVLLNDEVFEIDLINYPDTFFDIRIIDEDNDSYTYMNYDVSKSAILRILLDDLDKYR